MDTIKDIKYELISEVREAVMQALEVAEEKWVTAEHLSEQIECLSLGWLKLHGHELPRTKAAGSNRWCYPLHKINRLMGEGKIKVLS